MARVKVLLNNGKVKSMDSHQARALVHCKKAVYLQEYENKMMSSVDYLKKESPVECKNDSVISEDSFVDVLPEKEILLEMPDIDDSIKDQAEVESDDLEKVTISNDESLESSEQKNTVSETPKRRGRPPKNKENDE